VNLCYNFIFVGYTLSALNAFKYLYKWRTIMFKSTKLAQIGLSLATVLLLAACASTPKTGSNTAVIEDNTIETEAERLARLKREAEAEMQRLAAEKLTREAQVKAALLADPLLKNRSMYFDLDQYSVNPRYQPTLRAHAAFLSQYKEPLRIEGNADERGSSEYNLALGQRRAVAVADAFKVLGVSEDAIETVSFGEEKPKAEGHDEAAWSQNRRVDLRYTSEQ
jgi:peptidoglycan-associated lipoprotein